MIRSFYHHGAEVPATNLNLEQMRAALADAGGVLWIDISDIGPEDAEDVLARVFGFHPLTVDDCLEGVRRPKLDNYDDYIFIVIYANDQSTPVEDVNTIELDIYLGSNFVVTHHPLPLPAIDQIAERAMQDEYVMARGADILVYEILRAVESGYRPTVDFLSAAITGIEVEALTAPTRNTLRRMYELHHDVFKIRRMLTPQQDVVIRLAETDLQAIDAKNRLYFRELADRFVQMVETVETLREYLRGAMQTYLSIVAHQTHGLLRHVAAMVAIVLPLTLLTVLYDSSVRAILAQSTPYADIAVAGIVLTIAAGLGLYFHRS